MAGNKAPASLRNWAGAQEAKPDAGHAVSAPAQLGDKPFHLTLMHFARELWLFVRSLIPVRNPRRRSREARRRGRRIVVVPGLLASDRAMRSMRLALRAKGYDTYRWCLGRNLGATTELLDRFDARVRGIQRSNPQPVVLVGWSLGGLIAREYAKRAPDRVAAVVTLGSPFSGDIRSTIVARLYEWIAGHSIASLPATRTLSQKPPVPTAAVWSRDDGVIPAQAARGKAPEADYRVEVACAHLAYPSDPAALDAVLDAIDHLDARVTEPISMPAAGQAVAA